MLVVLNSLAIARNAAAANMWSLQFGRANLERNREPVGAPGAEFIRPVIKSEYGSCTNSIRPDYGILLRFILRVYVRDRNARFLLGVANSLITSLSIEKTQGSTPERKDTPRREGDPGTRVPLNIRYNASNRKR